MFHREMYMRRMSSNYELNHCNIDCRKNLSDWLIFLEKDN